MQDLSNCDVCGGENAAQTAILLHESDRKVAGETAIPLQVCCSSYQDHPRNRAALFIRTQQLYARELYLGQPSYILPSFFNGMGICSRGIQSHFTHIFINLNIF